MRTPTTLSKAVFLQGRFLVLRGKSKQIKLVSSKARAVTIINGGSVSAEKFSDMTGRVEGSFYEVTSSTPLLAPLTRLQMVPEGCPFSSHNNPRKGEMTLLAQRGGAAAFSRSLCLFQGLNRERVRCSREPGREPRRKIVVT